MFAILKEINERLESKSWEPETLREDQAYLKRHKFDKVKNTSSL